MQFILLLRFGPAYYQQNANEGGRLSDDNRGAQMMKKMGWGGAGLGSLEQGRQVKLFPADVSITGTEQGLQNRNKFNKDLAQDASGCKL